MLALLLAAALPPPAPIACLERYYAAKGAHDALLLPDGSRIPYDDGKSKTFEERLESPDVKDVFSIRYRRGPIRPVTRKDDDPGRIRLDPLFRATYGASEAAVKAQLVEVTIAGQKLPVHARAKPAFEEVARKLESMLAKDPALRPFLTGLGGTFNWRPIAGTDRASAHSYGVSLDLNTKLSDYWRWAKRPQWTNRIPQAIVDVFEASGFIWGGRWHHYDTMHFEWRPELLDPSCYPR